MTLSELLATCRRLGIHIAPVGADQIRVDVPPPGPPDGLLDAVRAHKSALLRLLTPPSPRPADVSCAPHNDLRRWQVGLAFGRPGWVRVTCQECGKFIGYNRAEALAHLLPSDN